MKRRGLVLLLLLTFTCLVLLVGAAVLSGVAVTQGVTEMRSGIEGTATALATYSAIAGGEATVTSQAGATQTYAAERSGTLRAQQEQVEEAIQATLTAKARLAPPGTP